MTYQIVHFYNHAESRETDYAAYFESSADALGDSLISAQRHRLSHAQFKSETSAVQDFTGLGLYEMHIKDAGKELSRIGEIIHFRPVREGLLSNDKTHVFEI